MLCQFGQYPVKSRFSIDLDRMRERAYPCAQMLIQEPPAQLAQG